MAKVIFICAYFNETSPGMVEIEREIKDDFDVILRIKSSNIRRMTIHNLPILHQIYINGVALPKQKTASVFLVVHEDGNWKVQSFWFLFDSRLRHQIHPIGRRTNGTVDN